MKHTLKQMRPKGREAVVATFRRLNLAVLALLWIAFCASAAAQGNNQTAFPGFRHIDPASLEAAPLTGGTVVLLADQDFAPWSFLDAAGQLQGISVDLARKACTEAAMTCELRPVVFEQLKTAFQSADVQGVISGPKLDAQAAAQFALTRPYFQTLGRFAVRTGSSLAAPDIRTLAGRRIGFRANSAHARFLETYYARSALTPFESSDMMTEALRTGQVDAIFGDAVQLSYWIGGQSSRGCCNFLGKAFVDRASFTRSLSFILKKDDLKLRLKFDDALDRLETKGATAEIFARYLPASLW
jgi:polar amino acid transport system substrate-binding protein